MTAAAFLAIVGLLALGAISPGPAVLMSARTGLTEGFRTGAFLAMGIGLGAVFWAGAALVGLAALFELLPSLLWAFKILGALFLVWVAVGMWRAADQPLVLADGTAPPRTALSALWLGIATQLTNPKPVVLLSSIFVGLVPPDTPLWVKLALLAVLFVNETVWNILVARIFSLDRTRLVYLGAKTLIDRCFGGFLALLGVKIAMT
jgi:threonine/homoserine/homoserine lactone efflux protein